MVYVNVYRVFTFFDNAIFLDCLLGSTPKMFTFSPRFDRILNLNPIVLGQNL